MRHCTIGPERKRDTPKNTSAIRFAPFRDRYALFRGEIAPLNVRVVERT
jgi:hypothetical protein